MKLKNMKKENISKYLLILGIGGFIALYFIRLSKVQLLPLSKKLEEMISSGNYDAATYIGTAEVFIILSIMIAIMICALTYHIKLFIFLALLFLDLAGIMSVIASGEIYPLYILIIYISSVYITWICFSVLSRMYRKLRQKEKKMIEKDTAMGISMKKQYGLMKIKIYRCHIKPFMEKYRERYQLRKKYNILQNLIQICDQMYHDLKYSLSVSEKQRENFREYFHRYLIKARRWKILTDEETEHLIDMIRTDDKDIKQQKKLLLDIKEYLETVTYRKQYPKLKFTIYDFLFIIVTLLKACLLMLLYYAPFILCSYVIWFFLKKS